MKTRTRITKAERDRTYHVALHALSEENRVMKLSYEELRQRKRDIWENCYGDLPENQKKK